MTGNHRHADLTQNSGARRFRENVAACGRKARRSGPRFIRGHLSVNKAGHLAGDVVPRQRIEAERGFVEDRKARVLILLLQIRFETTRRNHHNGRPGSLFAQPEHLEQRAVLRRIGRDMGVDRAWPDQSVALQDLKDLIEIAPLRERAGIDRIAQVAAGRQARDRGAGFALPFPGRIAGQRQIAFSSMIGEQRAASPRRGDAHQPWIGWPLRLPRQQRTGCGKGFNRTHARDPARRKQRLIGARAAGQAT